MSTNTKIEWTDATWSPIRVRVKPDAAAIARAKGYTSLVSIAEKMAGHVGQHCEHVSPECAHCYAETNNHRCLPGNGTGLPYDRRSRDLVEAFVDEKVLLHPLKWKPIALPHEKGVLYEDRPRRIFVENQSDLFAEWVTDEMLDRVFAMMALCPQHAFQVLTKRPERMLEYLSWPLLAASMPKFDRWPLPNVWLGVSDGGDQHVRIDILRVTPAAVRFVSAEPLIVNPGTINLDRIDWVIAGGESGPGARPMHPDWARSLRDQCQAAGVAFFFKQWGEWAPYDALRDGDYTHKKFMYCDGRVVNFDQPNPDGLDMRDWAQIAKPGKKAAGALLDGREWKQFPEAR